MQNIKLMSNDEVVIEVDLDAAKMSQLIDSMLQIYKDEANEEPIPIANVSGVILKKVMEWTIHHKDDVVVADDEDEINKEGKSALGEWDADFFNVDTKTLHALMMAASYMDIQPMLMMATAKASQLIMACNSVKEIQERFGITNDWGTEEEGLVRAQSEWQGMHKAL